MSDLSPLKGMKLTCLALQCHEGVRPVAAEGHAADGVALIAVTRKVSDLSPLKDMPLTTLDLQDTPVSDLSPLKGMPLTLLALRGHAGDRPVAAARDAAQDLRCDFKPERDAEILRSIKTLETINGKPAAEFWKEVDAKAANKKP